MVESIHSKNIMGFKVSEKFQRTLLVFVSLLILVISHLNFYASNNIITLVILLLLMFALIFFSSTNSFLLFVLLIPSERLLVSDSFPIGFLSVFLFLFFLLRVFTKRINTGLGLKGFVIVFVILLVTKQMYLNTISIDSDLIRFLINIFIMSTLIKNSMRNEKYVNSIFYFFIGGVLVSSIFSLALKIYNGDYILFSQYSRFSSLNQDPNYYATLISISLSLLAIKIVKKDNLTVNIPVYFVLFIFGVMTLSRSFFVSMTPSLMILSYFLLKSRIYLKLIAVLFAGVSGYILIRLGFLSYFFQRFQAAGGASDIRFEIWEFYLLELSQSLGSILFGIGDFSREMGIGLTAHNFLIASLAFNGALITIAIIYAFFSLFFEGFSSFSIFNKFLFVVSISATLFGYFFLDGISDNIFFYGLAIPYTILCVKVDYDEDIMGY